MSLLALLLAQAAPDAAAPDAALMLATVREAVTGPHCRYDTASTDITVCGLRHADRYRVPFVTHEPGDPRYETVSAERERLLHKTNPVQDLSPFLVGGGMAGGPCDGDRQRPGQGRRPARTRSLMLFALLLAQAAATAAPERFDILYDPCADARRSKDVVVCGKNGTASRRLPLPDDAPPTPNYVKPDSGDYRDNTAHQGGECAADMRGCLVGFGPPIVPMVAAAAHAIGDAAKTRREGRVRARDGDRRVAIDLTDPPTPAGKLEP